MTTNMRVLLIDSDLSWAHTVAERLKESIGGAQIEVRQNDVAELCTPGTRDLYDIVIMGKNVDPNFQHIRAIRKYYSEQQLPVIFVTDNEPKAEMRAMRHGANAYVDRGHSQLDKHLQHLVTALGSTP